MTRFAWLQARSQTYITAGLLAVLAVAAAITGVHLSHLYSSLVAPCNASTTDCSLPVERFLAHDHFLQNALELLLRAAPAFIGIFWGAPLLTREFETGTYRLAWTQSVTRSRWLITRLAVLGLTSMAAVGLLSLIVTWWFRAIDHVQANQYGVLDARNIVPVAYAAFAFAIGALIGAVVRRTLPTMVGALAVFVFVRVAVVEWVRPHLRSPLHLTTSLLQNDGGFGIIINNGHADLVAKAPGMPNAWVQSTHILTASGRPTTAGERSAFLHQYCAAALHPPAPGGGPGGIKFAGPVGVHDCRDQASHMFQLLVNYQPAGRYWTFQWMEAGIFLALALLAAGACFWWVTQRSS
jgi:hypothetical protein